MFLNIVSVPPTLGSGYELPTRNSEEPDSSIVEWKLRTKLEEENETVPDQKGKPTKRTTMKWIGFNFQGITELSTQKEGKI